ncbi:hypothetical protein [Streptomyces sp. NPDC048825]|uniref:hypothetical protein n=1 Tax=Streptomyces sp. NPDC048825 TaxID=3365592 RepID=UPI003710A113
MTEGLFAEGDRLTPTGVRQLTVFGGRLADRKAYIEIHGHVATVQGAPEAPVPSSPCGAPSWPPANSAPPAGKPTSHRFTFASADQQDAAPCDSAARNRTVTVVITPG